MDKKLDKETVKKLKEKAVKAVKDNEKINK